MKDIWKRIVLSRTWLVLPPIFVGVAAVVAFAQLRKELPRNELSEQARPLPVIRVQPKEVIPTVTGFGTASASRRWGAVAEVEGRIVEVHPDLDSGNTVQADELLIRIDATDSELLLSQRQADLDSAKAKLQELEAGFKSDQRLLALAQEQVEVATREEQRNAKLRHNRAVSLSEMDQARSSRLAQQQTVENIQRSIALYPSQISGAKASIALAEIKVREAERDIERTRIYSPFAGVLSGVNLEVGQFVGVKEQLFELLDDQQIEITAHFSLEQIEKLIRSSNETGSHTPHAAKHCSSSWLESGTQRLPFAASVAALSGRLTRTWNGVPVRIAESLNEQSRTLGIVIKVMNPPHAGAASDGAVALVPDMRSGGDFAARASALRPGTFCEVVLQSPPRQDLIAIPRSAMDGDVVYLVDGDNRLRSQQVVAGFSFEENVTILAGLSEGDIVARVVPVPAIAGQLIEPRLNEVASNRPELLSSAKDSVQGVTEERRQ